MKNIDSLNWIQIVTNLLLLGMIVLGFLALASRQDPGLSDISKGVRAQVNQICIEGDWEECHTFGQKELVEIKVKGDRSENGEMSLYIRKVEKK